MKVLRKIFLLLFIFFLPAICSAQSDSTSTTAHSKPKPPLSDRISVGGNFSFWFDQYSTFIVIQPMVGYRVTQNFTAGVGINYQYWEDKYYHVSDNIYGGSVFGRYMIFKGLFAETDFEMNNMTAYFTDAGQLVQNPQRKWIPSLLLGGGFYSGGRSGGFYLSVLYDVIQNPNSPYNGYPVIRAGVGFAL
jgi:hypothetical protein